MIIIVLVLLAILYLEALNLCMQIGDHNDLTKIINCCLYSIQTFQQYCVHVFINLY